MSTTPKADHHAAADDGIICEDKANYSPTFPCSIGGSYAIGLNEEQIGREQFASLKPPGYPVKGALFSSPLRTCRKTALK